MSATKKLHYQALDIYKDPAGTIVMAVLWGKSQPIDVFRVIGDKVMRCGAYLESSDVSESWRRISFTTPGEVTIESDKDDHLVHFIQFKNGIGTMGIKPPVSEEEKEVDRIAAIYRQNLISAFGEAHGRPSLADRQRSFAHSIATRNAWGVEFIANGLNDVGKKTFEEATGIKLPKGQEATWVALRKWGSISDAQNEQIMARRKVAVELKDAERIMGTPEQMQASLEAIDNYIKNDGLIRLVTREKKTLWLNAAGDRGVDMRVAKISKLRNLIEAKIRLFKADHAVAHDVTTMTQEDADSSQGVSNNADDTGLDATDNIPSAPRM